MLPLSKKFIVKSINRKAGLVREHVILVDAEDAYVLRNSYWAMANVASAKNGDNREQVIRRTPHGREELGHVLLGAPMDEYVFHINSNPLDFRKSNLLRQSERVREVE